jgi:AraC family transcriptional regulator
MIFNEFPDLQWLKEQAEKRFADRKAYDGTALKHRGWPTVILNVQSAETYRDNIRGPLSLFTNFSGSSQVSVDGKSVLIKEGCFFLSNPDQRYTLEIHRTKPAETFNIHFGENFADEVFHSLHTSAEIILHQPLQQSLQRVDFFNRLSLRSTEITAILQRIQIHKLAGIALEEQLCNLIQLFLIEERLLHIQSRAIPVIKSSTREEIQKRLLSATDYIHTYYDRDLSLDEVAAASCLSKFHFLRLFKILHQKTPHQFVNEVRVHRGQALLKHTTLEVSEIASAVGFSSASSFSRMFYQQTGSYPSAYRQEVAQ